MISSPSSATPRERDAGEHAHVSRGGQAPEVVRQQLQANAERMARLSERLRQAPHAPSSPVHAAAPITPPPLPATSSKHA